MGTAFWVVLVLLGGACVLAAWLWSSKTGAVARADAERSARETAARDLEQEKAASRALASRLEAAERAVAEATTEARVLNERVSQMSERHRDELESLSREATERAAAERRTLDEAKADFEARSRQRDEEYRRAIQAAAGEALKQSAEHLLKLTESKVKDATDRAGAELDARRVAVEGLLRPIADTLKKTEEKLIAFDRGRAESVAALMEQAANLNRAQEGLKKETAHLAQALRKPSVRGRYGEVQLRRVVELAGLRDYCDFSEQTSASNDEGGRLRPDMVVRMPGGRTVVIDAKTNIEPYLEAIEAADDERRERAMDRFAEGMSGQVSALAKKSYWEAVGGAPEFVVMFVPGDQFVDAALSRDPGLIERAAEQRVIIASPSTLIGLLRAVFVGWREHNVAEKAQELIALGRELHERAANVLDHADELGDALNKAVDRFNRFQGSLDTRLMPTLRRFEQLDAKSGKELAQPRPVSVVARVTAPLPLLEDARDAQG